MPFYRCNFEQDSGEIDTIKRDGFNNNFPDKFNTGYRGTLTQVSLESDFEVFNNKYPFGWYKTETTLAINFKRGTSADYTLDEYVVENYDFDISEIQIQVRQGDYYRPAKNLTLTFRDCQFRGRIYPYNISTENALTPHVKIRFEHCTLWGGLIGTDVEVDWCFFDATHGHDAMNPAARFKITNCYILGMTLAGQYDTHLDALQIYGVNGIDTKDMYIENYRAEMLNFLWSDDGSGRTPSHVNSCMMIQPEYNHVNGLTAKHCYIGGGPHCFTVNTGKNNWVTISNVSFEDIAICDPLNVYYATDGVDYVVCNPRHHNVVIKNVRSDNQCYCGSVWQDENDPYTYHLSLTNHADHEKYVMVLTEDGKSATFKLPAVPDYRDWVVDEMTIDMFPFDIEKTITTNGTSWILVYDVGTESDGKGVHSEQNLIKDFRIPMIQLQDVSYDFSVYPIDGTQRYIDLKQNLELTPSNCNYKLKYDTTDASTMVVYNDYLVVRQAGTVTITVKAGNYFSKDIEFTVDSYTAEEPIPYFYGSYYGFTDFRLSDDYPYFCCIGVGVEDAPKFLCLNNRFFVCNSSGMDRLTFSGPYYKWDETTSTWVLQAEGGTERTINSVFRDYYKLNNTNTILNEGIWLSVNYHNIGKDPLIKANYDQDEIVTARMREN